MIRLLAASAALAMVSAACAGSGAVQRQPEAIDDGVQATGVIDGRRVAISDGNPETNLVDCDPGDGEDQDVCWIARTIDGLSIAFVIENPAALVAGEAIPVRSDTCGACDDVRDHLVVDLRVGGEQRRATGGRLVVREVGGRFAARFSVTFPNADSLTGQFNIRQFAPGES